MLQKIASHKLNKIYFYFMPESFSDKREYPHMVIALGEGLKKLGFQLFSNNDYWRLYPNSDEFLFKHNKDVKPNDCSLVIFNHEWFWPGNQSFPESVFKPDRENLLIYFENFESDSKQRRRVFSSEFEGKFDFIFKSHLNRKLIYPQNMYPWAFGLSDRILQELQDIPEFQDRTNRLVVNFRHSKPLKGKLIKRQVDLTHAVRKTVKQNFYPLISDVLPIDYSTNSANQKPSSPYHLLCWQQTGKRHYPEYYGLLKSSTACACFGGWFLADRKHNAYSILGTWQRKLYRVLNLKSNTVTQWDSWRFWESLASGCVSFHVDLDKYGAYLPVMPKNWEHYIGIDLNDPKASIDKLKETPELLEHISQSGREWAIKHYSPIPTAIRFLNTISFPLPDKNLDELGYFNH